MNFFLEIVGVERLVSSASTSAQEICFMHKFNLICFFLCWQNRRPVVYLPTKDDGTSEQGIYSLQIIRIFYVTESSNLYCK